MPSSQTTSHTLGRVLILGGTSEARALAGVLVRDGYDVISSLAGRVKNPALPDGAVRIGGFGGPEGLLDYLRTSDICLVVDATHPFAARISTSAVAACDRGQVPILRLARPGWGSRAAAGSWTWVNNHDEAARAALGESRRVFLTTGRQSIDDFRELNAEFVLLRVVDPPQSALPDTWQVLTSRGPYNLDGERLLLREHRIDTLVTKDSGGALTAAKLDAAGELGVHVIVVRRPEYDESVPQVASTVDAAAWVRRAIAVRR
ncbi:precorrin-6A reductase [Antricoccus suffuscus]|uniref:Precorrin-6A reductase n=1 Tax=Antricoccus suffuscus TaxID=1629062 RepID=A0A2T1A085_9ACTN|nr:cobalt-precorrin-6A reductase [Antricoccus suffuscus]PRZ41748.1 precorrin-6A reductase [Antricoccus suffuscus]